MNIKGWNAYCWLGLILWGLILAALSMLIVVGSNHIADTEIAAVGLVGTALWLAPIAIAGVME